MLIKTEETFSTALPRGKLVIDLKVTGTNSVKCDICSCWPVRLHLAVLTLQHGEEKRAKAGPWAAAVLLGCFGVIRAFCARRRCGGGGAQCGWRRGFTRFSGLSDCWRTARVQLKVRVPWRTLAHAHFDQRALVLAQLAFHPSERSAELFPEAFGVGQESRAALGFGGVLAACGIDPHNWAGDPQDYRHPRVSRIPRALCVVAVGELSWAEDRSSVPAPVRSAWRGRGQREARIQEQKQKRKTPQDKHVVFERRDFDLIIQTAMTNIKVKTVNN